MVEPTEPTVVEKGLELFQIKEDEIWIGDKKIDYQDAHKLKTMAEALQKQDKLGNLSLDDFVLIMLMKEFVPKDETTEAEQDSRLGIIMREFKEKTSDSEKRLKEMEHEFRKLKLSDDDLNVETYQ